MTQDAWMLLAFKVVLVAGALSVTAFVARYLQMTGGAALRNEIGKTIIVKDILLILCLLPSTLSLFLHFSRLTSHIAGWTDVALFGLLTPTMLWRIRVWGRIHHEKSRQHEADEEEAAP